MTTLRAPALPARSIPGGRVWEGAVEAPSQDQAPALPAQPLEGGSEGGRPTPPGLGPLFLHPLLILLGRVHVEPAPHPGVAEPAQLRAGHLVLARLGCLEPLVDFPSRDHVL